MCQPISGLDRIHTRFWRKNALGGGYAHNGNIAFFGFFSRGLGDILNSFDRQTQHKAFDITDFSHYSIN